MFNEKYLSSISQVIMLPAPAYSPQFLRSIERTITKVRLSRYLAATSDLTQAVQLYEFNIELSEALYGILHGIEVSLRNAAHHALSNSYGAQDWYDQAPLTVHWMRVVRDAKNKVGGNAAPGKVIRAVGWVYRPPSWR